MKTYGTSSMKKQRAGRFDKNFKIGGHMVDQREQWVKDFLKGERILRVDGLSIMMIHLLRV